MKFWQQPRQPLAGLLFFAMLGIVAADFWPVDPLFPFILILVLAVLLCLRPSNAGARWFVAFAFFLLHDFHAYDMPGQKLAREFSETPQLVKATGIVVSEPSEKQTARDTTVSRFQLRLESLETNGRSMAGNARIQVAWMGETPKYGDRVSMTGNAANVAPPRNPGQFDYRAYLHRLGIESEIHLRYPNDGEILDSYYGNPAIAFAISVRGWMQEKLRLGISDSPDEAGIIQGIVLGRKNETSDDIRELFQRTGTLHLFVVNGLHIGMFTFIVFSLLKWLGARRSLSVVIAIPAIWFYALLTGFNPGSIRASLMATIMLAGWLVDGKPLALNNLGAAGFAMLLWDTNELFMPGFQFSMGVVFTIILLAKWFHERLAVFGNPDEFLPRSLWTLPQRLVRFCWSWVSNLIAVSIAASIGSLPFTMIYFHLISPAALIANPVIVPIAFAILWLGVFSMITATFSTVTAAIFNKVNSWFACLILWTVQHFAHIPLGHTYVGMPEFKYGLQCKITILDLPSGGAIHVHTQGKDWMLDCGNRFAYETLTLPYLRSRGINYMDGFVLTTGNTSHIGGAASLEDDFTPRLVVDSPLADRSKAHREFRRWLEENDAANKPVSRGDVMDVSTTTKLRVLYPPADLKPPLAEDKALVLMLESGGRRILFLSGSGPDTERWLLAHEPDLRSDILVKNQRETDNLVPGFFAAVHPGTIICSSADKPATQPVDETWMRDVKKQGIRLFRQDQTGAVRIDLYRDHFEVSPMIGDQAFLSNSR